MEKRRAIENQKIFVAATGRKYHQENCVYLKKSKLMLPLNQGISLGYTPCSRCKPIDEKDRRVIGKKGTVLF